MRMGLTLFIAFSSLALLYIYLKQQSEKNNKQFMSGAIVNKLIANNQLNSNTDLEKELDRKIADSIKSNIG